MFVYQFLFAVQLAPRLTNVSARWWIVEVGAGWVVLQPEMMAYELA